MSADKTDEVATEIMDRIQFLETLYPGLMYEVGTRIIGMNPAREFPGPGWGWYPGKDGTVCVVLTGFNPERRGDALAMVRKILGVPIQDTIRFLEHLTQNGSFDRPSTLMPNEAEKELAQWIGAGFTGYVKGLTPPATHTRRLGDLFGGPR